MKEQNDIEYIIPKPNPETDRMLELLELDKKAYDELILRAGIPEHILYSEGKSGLGSLRRTDEDRKAAKTLGIDFFEVEEFGQVSKEE